MKKRKNENARILCIILFSIILVSFLSIHEYSKKSNYPTRTIIECPEMEPAGNASFCYEQFNPHPAHRGLSCYREVVGEGESGNQCCYFKGEFCRQSPDRSGPAIGGNGNICKYTLGSLKNHFLDDVLLLNQYNGTIPNSPSVGDSCPARYKE